MEHSIIRFKIKNSINVQFYTVLLTVFALFINSDVFANGATVKTVVIDAGHGGKDPGAIGPNKTYEKDVALVVALKLGDYITKNFPDVNVIYTRKSDVFLELHERAEIANKNKADLFIAVHCNSSPNSETYGSSTYVLGLHRTEANLEVAKRENAVINLEENKDKNYEFDPNSPEGHIIMSMKQNAFLDQSINLASKMESQMENYGQRKSLGVKQAGFYVLYKTAMPSMLCEIGFISNTDEEKFLVSTRGQDMIATSLFNGFKDYKREIENGEIAVPVVEKTVEQPKPTATKTVTKTTTETTTKPAVETVVKTTTEEKVDNTPVKPNPTTTTTVVETTPAKPEASYVTIKSGKQIRKPSETNSGGGKGEKNVSQSSTVEPIYVKASNLNPFDTSSMSSSFGNKSAKNTNNASSNTSNTKQVTEPVVTPSTKENTVADTKGLVFRVQLFALKNEVKNYNELVKMFEGPLDTEPLPNGMTRYFTKAVSSHNEVERFLESAKAKGYAQAFIVGYRDGVRLTADQLAKELKK
jgi:N-acetylmuramoyl-L-alanine amidase